MDQSETTFDNKDSATGYVASLIRRAAGVELAALIANQDTVLTELEVSPSSDPSSFGEIKLLTSELMRRHLGVCWAIRDEDLKLFEAVLSGVGSTAGAAFLTFSLGGTISLGTAAVILGNVFVFFRRLRKKGVTLSDREFQILRALRASEHGVTVDELEGVAIFRGLGYGREEIEATLRQLADRRLDGGAVVALARRAGDGRWSAVEL